MQCVMYILPSHFTILVTEWQFSIQILGKIRDLPSTSVRIRLTYSRGGGIKSW